MVKIIEKIKNFLGIIDLEEERIKREKLDAEIKYYEEKLGLYGRDNTWTYIDYQYINNKGGRRNYLENLRDKVENAWENGLDLMKKNGASNKEIRQAKNKEIFP